MITAINIMLSIMGCNSGNGDSESEATDVVVDTNVVDEMVVVLAALYNGDDCVDSSLVTCDSEAIVRLVACDPSSSKFKCSMQIIIMARGRIHAPMPLHRSQAMIINV